MNRIYFIFIAVFLGFIQVHAQRFPAHRDTVNVGHMKFDHSYFSFGDIVQGTRVNHTYEFSNTGKTPLVIENVLVTCGCTVPEWPKTPILPGKSSKIRVFFNSAGKNGIQNKTITILANTKNGRESIVFHANVIPPKQ
jgi:Protein of unknown function (DUF1573)